MADNLGAIFQAALSLAGLMAGPLFGVFISAIFNPYSETIGIIIGNLCGVVMACSAYLGAKDDPPGTEFTKPMPTEISGCFGDFQCQQNSTERWCQVWKFNLCCEKAEALGYGSHSISMLNPARLI